MILPSAAQLCFHDQQLVLHEQVSEELILEISFSGFIQHELPILRLELIDQTTALDHFPAHWAR